MPPTVEKLAVRIASVTAETDAIRVYELKPEEGASLPGFTAGSHVDVLLPGGLIRSYSLCNAQEERDRYLIAVSRDRASRGGSRLIHDTLKAGDSLSICVPRNNFGLFEEAAHSVLIAGGIGITPVWSMVQRLIRLERSWELHYCARTRADAAFLESISALDASASERIHLNFDHEPGAALLDIDALVRTAPDTSHFYCCGPTPMIASFERACALIAPDRVHVEYFTPKESASTGGGFSVKLARAGVTLEVPPGKSILQAILDTGLHVPHSCTEGTCGSCETVVLEGTPDHRDSLLSEAERASNETMMICCSGSVGPELVLDI